MRTVALRGRSAALMGALLAGSVVLWVGVPIAWLWVAGQVQGATNSLGTALGVALFGVLVSIAVMINALVRISERHRVARRACGRPDPGHVPLETVMVLSAGATLLLFLAWFFLLSGSSPAPVSVSV